jgi:hypothetical protein
MGHIPVPVGTTCYVIPYPFVLFGISGQRPAIGFVFLSPAQRDFIIISFRKRVYVDLPANKLALFFQTPFRSTQNAARNTSKLALFFQTGSKSQNREFTP